MLSGSAQEAAGESMSEVGGMNIAGPSDLASLGSLPVTMGGSSLVAGGGCCDGGSEVSFTSIMRHGPADAAQTERRPRVVAPSVPRPLD